MRGLAGIGLVLVAIALLGAADRSSGALGEVDVLGPARILYASDWSGPSQIYAVVAHGRGATGQVTFGPAPACSRRPGVWCGFTAPEPSPDGRWVLFWDDHYQAGEVTLYIARADGRRRLAVAENVPRPDRSALPEAVWSPDSRRVAYRVFPSAPEGDWHVVNADGKSDRVVPPPSWIRGPGQSPDGRWVATAGRTGLLVRDTQHDRGRTFPLSVHDLAWSRDSRFLALAAKEGIYRLDTRTNRTRRLTTHTGTYLAWSPDAMSVAFVQGADPSSPDVGDLRLVTTAGRVRTVVDAAGGQGGLITGVVWTRPPRGTSYRRAAMRFPITSDELVAPWPIVRLAADGDRVAFASCGHVFVWEPGRGDVTQADAVASLSPRCSGGGNYLPLWTYDLALSGERVAWGELSGNMGRSARLDSTTLGVERATATLAVAYGAAGPHTWKGIGELTGSGGLLVFSSWVERYVGGKCCSIFTAEQSIRHVASEGCPCPSLRTEPGPLVPLDIDHGRIVAAGDNALLLLDSRGAELVSIPVRADAAMLSGQDLVVLVRGEMRVYDARDGALVKTWPLPDLPTGQTCGSLNMDRCFPSPRLRLEDVARGLVAYVVDGDVHLLRLGDGAGGRVARGAHARFTDSGLVYADGSRLRLVLFARLPFR